jgi:hypothetical chaperone protein
VFGRSYGPEHLVRPILSALKERAERATGAPVTAVTLGRPVLFSTDPEADAAAEARLAKAARLAGFEEIRFRREPEAAGWSYASRLRGESRVLVADLGGGTADFTLLLLRPGGPHEALATAGVRIGGDDFDAAIMAGRLTPLFGRGSTYESWGRQLEVPPHIYAAICRWDLIPFLKESRTRRDLRYILSGASDPEAIGRLIALIDRDLGYALFREIASAKHRLSESEAAKIAFDEEPIAISVEISRRELEGMIADKVEQLKAEAVRTIALAGLAPEDVDACFLTGGSSLVPAIGRVFHALFGAERVHAGDTFTSVAMGLALIAAAG